MVRAKVLIADDHTLVAEALKRLLEEEFEVVSVVQDGHHLVNAAERYNPDIVIADVGMPGLNGLKAGQRIKKLLPALKLVYVTVNQDAELIAEAFRTGASAFLSKRAAGSELLLAMHTVLSGELYLSSGQEFVTEVVVPKPVKEDAVSHELTERQLDVLQLLAEGKSMKEVAAELNLATRTVAFHKYRLMKSLKLKNDAEIVQYAIRQRIIFDQRISR